MNLNGTDRADGQRLALVRVHLDQAGLDVRVQARRPGRDDGDVRGCTSPRTLGPLADGAYTFSVRATDAAGNVDATPATRTFTVDTAAPDTTINGGPDGHDDQHVAVVRVHRLRGRLDVRVQARRPGAAPARTRPARRRRPTARLADGAYTFSVRATRCGGQRRRHARDARRSRSTRGAGHDDHERPDRRSPTTRRRRSRSPRPSRAATFECKLDAGAAAGPYAAARRRGPGGWPTARTRSRCARDRRRAGNATRRRRRGRSRSTRAARDVLRVRPGGRCTPARWPSACARQTASSSARSTTATTDRAGSSCGPTRWRSASTSSALAPPTPRATSATPAEWPFTVVNETPVAKLDLDADTGVAPHTLRATVTGTDADNDRLTYELDFGDGQKHDAGALPAAAIAHRYEAAGNLYRPPERRRRPRVGSSPSARSPSTCRR